MVALEFLPKVLNQVLSTFISARFAISIENIGIYSDLLDNFKLGTL